jgi:hypothetical protein
MNQRQSKTNRVQKCKNCGKPFHATGDTIANDEARGLSATLRCGDCRNKNKRFLAGTGARQEVGLVKQCVDAINALKLDDPKHFPPSPRPEISRQSLEGFLMS